MKQLPRNPMRFDVFDTFARFAREHQIPLYAATAQEDFVAALRTSIARSLQDERLLHGRRTEAMFEAMVASLGQVQVLKQEDAGEVYLADDTLKVPDFRLVLTDGSQLLVEVKNHYQQDPGQAFAMSSSYLDGLVRYATQMNCELKVAVYWARWNTWTLVSPTVVRGQGERASLTFEDALRANEMWLLGDLMIGTRFPLRLRLYSDPTRSRSIDEHGEADFTASAIEMFCAERQITDETERNIAFQLMLFGDWPEEDEVLVVDNKVEWIEFRFHPTEESGQEFAIIGSLSGMFSRAYALATLEAGTVKQLRTSDVPSRLGRLIPEGYKGKALPIWRLSIRPSFVTAAGSWKDVDADGLVKEIYESRERSSRPPIEL